MTSKAERKSDIGFLALVAHLQKQCQDKDGVISILPWLDRRKWPGLSYMPGVFMHAYKFMELFGEDTEYEYITDREGDRQVYTIVNGVSFFAYVGDDDAIKNGRLTRW